MFTYRLCHFEIFMHSSVNSIFKVMLIGKYIFVIFLNLCVIRNFRGTCSSIEMLKGYIHGQRKFGNTCPKHEPGQQRQTINESVCCFDGFLTWFTDLHGNK